MGEGATDRDWPAVEYTLSLVRPPSHTTRLNFSTVIMCIIHVYIHLSQYILYTVYIVNASTHSLLISIEVRIILQTPYTCTRVHYLCHLHLLIFQDQVILCL